MADHHSTKEELIEEINALRKRVAHLEAKRIEPGNAQLFNHLVEISNIFPWESDLGMEKFTYVGAQMERLLGYPVQKWYEADFWKNHLYPDDAEWVQKYNREKALQKAEYEMEYRMISANGSSVWLHHIVNVFYENEKPTGLKGFMVNITARKRAMNQLKTQRRFLREIIDTDPNLIFVKDWDGRFALVNKAVADIYGTTVEDLTGRTDADFNSNKEEVEHFLAFDRSVMTSQKPHFIPEEVVTDARTGKQRWFQTIKVPLMLDDENKRYVLGVASDVSVRKEAEMEREKLQEQILQAQKLESLGIMAGGIAHDFNNLLTGILGNAELAQLDLPIASPAHSSIRNITKASLHAAELCKQMLAYSGRGKFVVRAFNINQIIQEMTHLLSVSMSKKTVIQYNLQSDLPAIEADATQIRQVIMNLVTNAAEAIGEENGVLSVHTGVMSCDAAYLAESYAGNDLPAGNYIYLEVSDTGSGIPKNLWSRIFDPFFTTKFTGRGLGLAAVSGIVRGHKGAIKLYSEMGKGTSIKVLFPLSEKEQVEMPVEKKPSMNWRGSGKVLIIDDEETVRQLTSKHIERLGFEAVTAIDGYEGITTFKATPDEFNLVLLDLTMPKMNGEETFEELRKIRHDIQVILFSGYNEQEISQRFSGKGLAGFIQKPYRLSDLIAKLKALDLQGAL